MISGTVGGDEYDRLAVAGDLTPGGTLQISLIDGFAPDVGAVFDVFDWGSLAEATFDAIELPELVGRKAWDTSGLYSTGAISVIGMLPGDTDVDWDVDYTDYNNFVAVFGGTGDWRTDFNEDGVVDLSDFAIMRGNFGFGVEPAPDVELAAPAPEPTTLVLLGLGSLAVLRKRRKQWQQQMH